MKTRLLIAAAFVIGIPICWLLGRFTRCFRGADSLCDWDVQP